MEQENLFGKTLSELDAAVKNLELPSYCALQIAEWMYRKNVSGIDLMTNISLRNRYQLSEKYKVDISPFIKVQVSADGTKKYLFPVSDGKLIESAYIPEGKRSTLCLSTQVGCKMGCLFCMTGKQGFHGNLTSSEILNQVQSLPEKELLTNLVFMGMGEPFDNLTEVMKSLEILTAAWGFSISPRRITVSTIGLIPAMKVFLEQSQCHLAISLHSPFEEERKMLMPVETVYPIKKVIEFVKKYDWSKQRRISIEYIMFRGLNDTPLHVKQLSRLLNGLSCRINLIRYHAIPDAPLESTRDEDISIFRKQLNARGIIATVRKSRGEDIYAACGLLSTKEGMKKI